MHNGGRAGESMGGVLIVVKSLRRPLMLLMMIKLETLSD
jgi:hypothetical protein